MVVVKPRSYLSTAWLAQNGKRNQGRIGARVLENNLVVLVELQCDDGVGHLFFADAELKGHNLLRMQGGQVISSRQFAGLGES